MRLICLFDIVENKTRRRVNRVLEGVGYRIQESVYACELSPKQFNVLQKEIALLLEEDDRVHYYPLCGKDIDQSEVAGAAELVNIPEYTHIG